MRMKGRVRAHPVVFISYKWENDILSVWVEKLARDLRARGIEALLDKWEVRLGESFSDYMTSAVRRCDAFLFVITPASVQAVEAPGNDGGAVKFEVQLATARRLAGGDFRFIGLLREGDRPPTHLQDARYCDFRQDAEYETQLALLVSDLQDALTKPEVVSSRNLEDKTHRAVDHIWPRIPHRVAFLMAPASAPLQTAVRNHLTTLIREEGIRRGYLITLVSVQFGSDDRDGLRTFFDVLADTTPSSIENSLRDRGGLSVRVAHYYDPQKPTSRPPSESLSHNRTVFVALFQCTESWNSKLRDVLYDLRGYVSNALRENDILSVGLMLADIDLNDQDMNISHWANIYEHVEIR